MESWLLRTRKLRLIDSLMRNKSIVTTLLLCLLSSNLLAQMAPTPQQGSVVVEYSSLTGNTPYLLGLDLSTQSRFIVQSSPNGDFKILFVDREGTFFEGRAGESSLIPSESDVNALPIHAFAEAFPFLLSELIPQLPDDAITVETQPDGTSVYSCQLISGGLGLTIRGLPEGFESVSREIRYTFSREGKLLSKHDVTNDLLEEFSYVDSDCPQLAIPSSFADGNWVISDFECYESFPAHVFDEAYITDRARTMLINYNEWQRERTQTPEAQRSLADSIDKLSGDPQPIYTRRWALIITGILVIAVGFLAWWKNRA